MDQLKTALAMIKKHHFWLLAVVCVIGGVVAWKMASGSMSQTYTQRKSTIEGAFQGLATIQGEANYPNARWQEEMSKLTQEERAKVREAWELVYNEQKALLKWPESLNQVGKSDFVETMESISWGGDIPEVYRTRYARLIGNEISNLLAIVGAAGKSGDGARVAWSEQDKLKKQLDWGGKTPSSMQVWLAQEDLWVYAAVLTIISKVNEGQYVPSIRAIDELLIGAEAADELSKGMQPGKVDGSMQAAAAAQMDLSGGPSLDDPGEGAPLDAGRYVDATGTPMAGGAAAQEQFKRMPVFMRLRIDQRHIPKLLVECANSPLSLEVQQFRMAPGSGDKSSKKAEAPAAEAASFDVPIELGGVIYIYNKPDMTKLGGEATAAAGG